MIGHSLGGIGAVEMAACALAIDRGVVPPTANWRTSIPNATSTTRLEARRRQIDAALSTGSGFGGFQSAMILARPKSCRRWGSDGPGSRVLHLHAGCRPPGRHHRHRRRRARRISNDAWWNAAKAGERLRRITRFDPSQYPAQLAGEVDGFDATDYLEQRLIVQTDHWTHGPRRDAVRARRRAVRPGAGPYRMSVITSSGSGGNEFGQKEIENLGGRSPIFVGAYQSIAWFYAATTGQIAIKYGMKGPCGSFAGGRRRPGGAVALAAEHPARRRLRRVGRDRADRPYALTCQLTNGRLSLETDPADAYRPFDERANGYVMGEVAQS